MVVKKFKILDTETTKDFCESLIGMTFYQNAVVSSKDGKNLIELITCDGLLLFELEELEEVF